MTIRIRAWRITITVRVEQRPARPLTDPADIIK
jgi:hypothetical protein